MNAGSFEHRIDELEQNARVRETRSSESLDLLMTKVRYRVISTQAALDEGSPICLKHMSIVDLVALAVVRQIGPVRTPKEIEDATIQVIIILAELDRMPERPTHDEVIDQFGISDIAEVQPREGEDK